MAQWPMAGNFTKKLLIYTVNGGKSWMPLEMKEDSSIFYVVLMGMSGVELVYYYYKGIRLDGSEEINNNSGNYYTVAPES